MATRQAWVRAVHEARALASRIGGATVQPEGLPPTAIADYAHLARDLKAATFPVEGASAMALAEAFLAGGRALAVAATEDRRAASAAVLAAAAEALDDIIEADRGDAAARTWGRHSDL